MGECALRSPLKFECVGFKRVFAFSVIQKEQRTASTNHEEILNSCVFKISEKRAGRVVENSKAGAFGCILESTDRKSTRLNSSHMSISYAVFCLKKKKKKKK